METSAVKWEPLVIHESAVLMKYYQLKFLSRYENDCDFLLSLLDLLESQCYAGRAIKSEIEEIDVKYPVGCLVDREQSYNDDFELPVECIMEDPLLGNEDMERVDQEEDLVLKQTSLKERPPKRKAKKSRPRKKRVRPKKISIRNRHNFCYICLTVKFHTPALLQKHFKKEHPEDKPFKCTTCNNCFDEYYDLQQHRYESQHKKSVRKCDECGKMFTNMYDFVNHKVKHRPEERRFSCNQCHKKFYLEKPLQGHIKRMHPDSILSMSGETKGQLKGQTKFQEGMLYCKQCNYSSKSETKLKEHARNSHGTVEKIPCEVCGKFITYNQSQVKKHMLTHATVRPRTFSCDQCEKTYWDKSNLQLHKRAQHDCIRDYICEVCSRTFVKKSHLGDHMRIHTGERPYKCPLCPSDFNQCSALYKHGRLKHKGYKLTLNKFVVTLKRKKNIEIVEKAKV